MLPFLFKDFLLFSGRVESRDNICIIEHHLIDRNHTCMYLAKSHLSTAYVLRDRPPPSLVYWIIGDPCLNESTPEPTIRSCGIGQRISCFDICQLTTSLIAVSQVWHLNVGCSVVQTDGGLCGYFFQRSNGKTDLKKSGLLTRGRGGTTTSRNLHIYEPPIYDITSGCRFRARHKDGRPMLLGFLVIFTHRLTELCTLNAENVEKVYSRPFK